MWQAFLEDFKHRPSSDPYATARVCMRLGDTKAAFLLLDKAYREHDERLAELLMDDCWYPLRGDPRFQDIVKRVGLKPK